MSSQLQLPEKLRERTTRLVARCGASAHLVPATVLLASTLHNQHPIAHQAYVACMETFDAIRWLVREPFVEAFQAVCPLNTVECRHCQDARPLRVQHVNRSGSSAEGLYDVKVGAGGTSDYDVMLEFGPLTWTAEPVQTEEPDLIDAETAPRMWAKPTDRSGFVNIHWARTTLCSHDAPLQALPADSIRRLMKSTVRTMHPTAEIDCPGPAVNAMLEEDKGRHGGIDHVPCIRVPWWPAKSQFLSRHQAGDFLPMAIREDIVNFGIHLVPTGSPGSESQLTEHRVSLSRAETVAARYLSPVQHCTATTAKAMKKILKESGVETSLKSYYIKTAVLWMAEEKPSHCWNGVSAGVRMVLDWLGTKVATGNLPCFFWPEINLVAFLGPDELQAVSRTVQLMKRHSDTLLMACCVEDGMRLDPVLEDGPEPLPERELRRRLARSLVWSAVINAIRARPDAPCWKAWFRHNIAALPRDDQLIQWRYHCASSNAILQCKLWQAWTVLASEDLAEGAHPTSQDGEMLCLDVLPLVSLLTETDMELLLREPESVAAWCDLQLRRPPEDRPAGLTAPLNTPRGRAEVLLQPELYLQALRGAAQHEKVPHLPDEAESVTAWCDFQLLKPSTNENKDLVDILNTPLKTETYLGIKKATQGEGATYKAIQEMIKMWLDFDRETAENWAENFMHLDTYQDCQYELRRIAKTCSDMWILYLAPMMGEQTAAAIVHQWRQELERLMSGDRLLTRYNSARVWQDNWKMRQLVIEDDSPSADTRTGDGSQRATVPTSNEGSNAVDSAAEASRDRDLCGRKRSSVSEVASTPSEKSRGERDGSEPAEPAPAGKCDDAACDSASDKSPVQLSRYWKDYLDSALDELQQRISSSIAREFREFSRGVESRLRTMEERIRDLEIGEDIFHDCELGWGAVTDKEGSEQDE